MNWSHDEWISQILPIVISDDILNNLSKIWKIYAKIITSRFYIKDRPHGRKCLGIQKQPNICASHFTIYVMD